MTSRVFVRKEIAKAHEGDEAMTQKQAEEVLVGRIAAFEQVEAEKGPREAYLSDRLVGDYLKNWLVGGEYRERGLALRAAIREIEKEEAEAATPEEAKQRRETSDSEPAEETEQPKPKAPRRGRKVAA